MIGRLLTPEEVRDVLRLDRVEQVYELTRSRAANRLPAIHCGKYLRISESDLVEWLEARRVRAGE